MLSILNDNTIQIEYSSIYDQQACSSSCIINYYDYFLNISIDIIVYYLSQNDGRIDQPTIC